MVDEDIMSKRKEIKKYNKMLRKYQTKREFVKIARTVTKGEANIYGVILELSDNFMHLAENDEFKFNGEVIIRMDHFDSIRCNKFDKTFRKILAAEKQLSKSKPKRTQVDLTDWASIFTDLQKSDVHVTIECEDLKKPTFTIGPIEKINKKSVDIRNYDATGQLDKKVTRTNFKNITLLKYNEEYSTTFRKYLKQPKRSKKNGS